MNPFEDNSWLDQPIKINLLLVKEIIARREHLAILANHHLPQDIINSIGLLGTVVDDTRAHATWEALTKRGFQVPSGLDTRGIFMYHRVDSVDLAEILYDMNFRNIDDYDSAGQTPLMEWLCRPQSNLDIADWFLGKGADPLRVHRDHDINALHLATRSYSFSYRVFRPLQHSTSPWWIMNDLSVDQLIDPIVIDRGYCTEIVSLKIQRLLQEIPPTIHDSCRCACSTFGCTPTTMLYKNHQWELRQFYLDAKRVYYDSSLLYSWYIAIAAVGVPVNEIREEVRRIVAFANMGLTHTCCRPYPLNEMKGTLMPKEDVDEIRDEEEEMIDQQEQVLRDHESRPWKSSSRNDYLCEVDIERPPPTLRWANLVTIRAACGLDEKDCEEIRQASGILTENFW